MDGTKYSITLMLVAFVNISTGAKLLIWPYNHGFNSRLMNMEKMSNMLVEAGHSVDWIISTKYDESSRPLSSDVTIYKYQVPDEVPLITDAGFIENLVNAPTLLLPITLRKVNVAFCESLITSKLWDRLKLNDYDVLIIDYVDYCGAIGIDYLEIPTMLYSNFGIMHAPVVNFPFPWSFNPHFMLPFTQEMSFAERVQNVIAHFTFDSIGVTYFYQGMYELKRKYNLNTSMDYDTAWTRAKIIINNAHYAFDLPRATLPNHIMIGGLFNSPSKPLDTYFQRITSAAPNGVVIVSFGTLFRRLANEDTNEMLALAFSKLNQTVIWKYEGEPLKNKGPNTFLVKWLPQNDLLGHPSVKLFVTHGGISSSHEAIYHGVPIVGIPLFMDQPANVRRLTQRCKMGVEMNAETLTSQSLLNAMKHVMDEPSFKTNAKKMSLSFRDNPVSPRDTLLYWVEQVAIKGRSGDLEFLRPHAAYELSWMQYHSLDVFLFIFTVIVILLGLIFIGCRCCIVKICCANKKKEKTY
ncbi:unnamed protein product [Owenia fusiformis]|uniref:UDP-glucuronosyltransferase n=1 Tax=Owenia fusiformis TaxID=6347 RepID=A0A8S4Q9N8_OWEFU|nr:unnamed protein product [Owenia fusiformis]